MHLNTLNQREVSEADEKYSAMVSAPFPLNILHFFTAPILINLRKVGANMVVLHLYYFPVAVASFAVFSVYQVLVIPLCYVKIVMSPQGHGARTTLDRAGHALLFMALGPLILTLNVVVDLYWYVVHLYKMDLEKSVPNRQ